MTLKQAFTLWANAPKNVVLAAKYREAVQRVLMKKWSTTELQDITEPLARKIFAQSPEYSELKAKAASVLVQLLQWGAENGQCQPPTFSVSIASGIQEPPQLPPAGEPLVKVKPEALAKRKEDLAARGEQDVIPVVKRRKSSASGRPPRPFAQIDPKTLEVVKVWSTMKEAERETGACNIDRASKLIRKSAGFYWSDAAEADTFKDRLIAKIRGIGQEETLQSTEETVTVQVACPSQSPSMKFKVGDRVCFRDPEKQTLERGYIMTADPSTDTYIVGSGGMLLTIHEANLLVINEGYSAGYVTKTDTSVLSEFTDEELWKELERRGWHGELSRRQVIKIGEKE